MPHIKDRVGDDPLLKNWWGYGTYGNPEFFDASGRDPFRKWWQDPDRLEAYLMAMEDLWKLLEKTILTAFPPTANTMLPNPNGPPGYILGSNANLSGAQIETFMQALKLMTYLSGFMKGNITLSSKSGLISAPNDQNPLNCEFEYYATSTKEVTFTDLLKGLVNAGPTLVGTFFTKDKQWYGTSELNSEALGSGFMVFRSDMSDFDEIWNTFVHELLHFNSSGYAGDLYSPERDIEPFLKIRPKGKW